MQGDPAVLEILNEHLSSELTAINQYFLHARMQANWGFHLLAKHSYGESIEEMKHAELVTDRILLLNGLPNFQRLYRLRIGQTVPEQFVGDLALEMDAIERLRRGVILCRERGDATSARLFEEILADEELHVDWLEIQLSLLQSLGEPRYLAQQLGGLTEPA